MTNESGASMSPRRRLLSEEAIGTSNEEVMTQACQNGVPYKRPVICVFCGASTGNNPVHLEAARSLAKVFHENDISLVYGGGTVGVMGELARTLVALSGPQAVHGVIPTALVKHEQGWDPANPSDVNKAIDMTIYGQTTMVKDMHTRKQVMARAVIEGGPGSGFVALSGGFGTLEELMEVTTWNQLGIHNKGVVLFNVDGYWDGLLQWVRAAVSSGFVSKSNASILVEALSASDVVTCLRDYHISDGRLNLEWNEEG